MIPDDQCLQGQGAGVGFFMRRSVGKPPGSIRIKAGILTFGLSVLSTAGATAAELTVRGGDLLRIGRLDWIAPGVTPDEPDPDLPLIDPAATGTAAKLLRGLNAEGRAAGFDGVVYDNRDAGHSTLPPDLFPQLTRLAYDDQLRAANLDYGLGGQILLPAIVIGNSSTARTGGAAPRSLPRIAMTSEGWPERAFRSYVSNQIYIYPEHRDHDTVDLFPANWPYTITSQGSSGSDKVFLRSIAMTLAAMAPETRKMLQRAGLVAPTIQMILRRSLKNVTSREAYLSGAAHPTVFDGTQLNAERMISLAASLKSEDIPPMVRLAVVDEDFVTQAGLGDLSERLFDTPSAIARIWRRLEGRSRIVVTAGDTRDPNRRVLSYSWVLLRGDPEKVRIEPLDAAGTTARIIIDWQEARPIASGPSPGGEGRLSSRIDIGVFAWNGVYDSAPAFITVDMPTHQRRIYDAQPDGGLRLASVDYDALARKMPYDPLLYWSAAWRDDFVYDESGALAGWRRMLGTDVQEFDPTGQPADGAALSYRMLGAKGRWPQLEAVQLNGSGDLRNNR